MLKDKLDKIEIFASDIRNPNGVKETMNGIDVVFHLAALIAIPFSYHSPDSYVDTNIKGTLNILQVARYLGTKRILVTSTSEVYGTAQYMYQLMRIIHIRYSHHTVLQKLEQID